MGLRSKARRFWGLSRARRRLLLSAAFWLLAIRLGLAVLSFESLRKLLSSLAGRAARRDCADPLGEEIDRVAWAVSQAGRSAPFETSCFHRALATYLLLLRRGLPGEIHIGVARGEQGQFEAHAWVRSCGRVIMGALPDLERFEPLPRLGEKLL